MEKLNIYTDGSHFKDRDYIGYGAICSFEGKEYRMSGNIGQQVFKDFYKIEESVSNPTAEMVAAAVVLKSISAVTVPIHVEIIADYLGVKEWNQNNWKSTKVYIAELIRVIRKYSEIIEKSGGMVTYRHIRGHQKGNSPDVIMNAKSDVLAKSLDVIDEFPKLVELIVNKLK